LLSATALCLYVGWGATRLALPAPLLRVLTVAPSGSELAAQPDAARILLRQACDEAAQDPRIRAIVLGGAALGGWAAALGAGLRVPLIDSVAAGARALWAFAAAPWPPMTTGSCAENSNGYARQSAGVAQRCSPDRGRRRSVSPGVSSRSSPWSVTVMTHMRSRKSWGYRAEPWKSTSSMPTGSSTSTTDATPPTSSGWSIRCPLSVHEWIEA